MIIHDVEQRSPEWYALRRGTPSASGFGNILTPSTAKESASIETYAYQLAAEIFSEGALNAWGGNVDMERGRHLEEQAVGFYEITNDVSTDEVGFITDDDGAIGCSPDRLIGDEGMMEVKCLNAENHVHAMMHWKAFKTIVPKYRAQTQGQIHIAERKWCDLVFHHPQLPMVIIRQPRNVEYIDKLKSGITKLITRRDEIVQTLREY